MRVIVIAMLLLVVAAHAENFVAINSMDGRDVLSGIFYANVKGIPVEFMPYPAGSSDIFAAKVGQGHSILLIQSSNPVSSFVQSSLEGNNNTVEIYNSTDAGQTNLDLATKSGAQGFIIVDSAYSDSAISVLPYAAMKKYYVILADKNNIDQVKNIVAGKQVIIYGLVDTEVTTALSADNPEIIGTGVDKYQDNIEIVNKTMNEFGLKSVIITDGTIMEDSIAKGDQPVLLTGNLVPIPTYNFVEDQLQTGNLNGVLLIGNTLVNPIYDMRQRIISDLKSKGLNKTFGITVKFAQVIPSSGTGVLSLDTFAMPAYVPNLNITYVSYNTATKNVTVSLSNLGDGAAYYATQIAISVNGNQLQVLGDNQTTILERGEQVTNQYPIDLSSVQEGNVTAQVLVKYGASLESLDQFATAQGPLTTVSYVDNSNVSVQSAKYDGNTKTVLVTLKNNGNMTAYEFSKLDLVVNGSYENISASNTHSVDPSSLIVEEFPIALSDSDLAANQNVSVFVDYGGREGVLSNKAEYVLPLDQNVQQSSVSPLLIIAGIIIVLALVFYFYSRKK